MLRLGERAMQSGDGLGELLAMGDVTFRNAADAFEDADVELVGIFEPDLLRACHRHARRRIAALRRLVSLGGAKARDGAATEIKGARVEAAQHHAVEDIRQILLPQHHARSFAVPASGKRGLDRLPGRGIATVFAIGAIAFHAPGVDVAREGVGNDRRPHGDRGCLACLVRQRRFRVPTPRHDTQDGEQRTHHRLASGKSSLGALVTRVNGGTAFASK
jgi:hypothetical protein